MRAERNKVPGTILRLYGARGPALVLLVALAAAFLTLDRPLIRGDGLAYLAWLDSLTRDLDLDLANQARRFAHLNTYQLFLHEPTGRWATAFPFGVALLQWPFYLLGHALDAAGLLQVNPDYFLSMQGVGFPQGLLVMLGNNVIMAAAALLALDAAHRLGARPWIAAGAALAAFLGTPLVYYATIDPLNSHVAGALLVTLLVWIWVRWPKDPRAWLAMGLAGGLAFLTRWQLALVLPPLALLALAEVRAEGLRPPAARLGALTAGFLALAWLQPYLWWRQFGSLLAVPGTIQTQEAFLVGPKFIPQVLLSLDRGLFVWSPVALLALAGLPWLYRRRPALAGVALLILALQVLINASVADWWAGFGFGMRRMAEMYPLIVLGLAGLLEGLGRAAAVALPAAVAVYGLLLLTSHLNYINTNLESPQGTVTAELRHHAARWRVTPQVFKEHYGVWAWPRPGP